MLSMRAPVYGISWHGSYFLTTNCWTSLLDRHYHIIDILTNWSVKGGFLAIIITIMDGCVHECITFKSSKCVSSSSQASSPLTHPQSYSYWQSMSCSTSWAASFGRSANSWLSTYLFSFSAFEYMKTGHEKLLVVTSIGTRMRAVRAAACLCMFLPAWRTSPITVTSKGDGFGKQCFHGNVTLLHHSLANAW